MQVLCVRFIDSATAEVTAPDGWLRLHEEYEVLEVYARPDRRVQLRIASEEMGSPVLFDSEMFVTSDGRIPENWVVEIDEEGALVFGPERWLVSGFWEDYFDQEPSAVAIYDEEISRIMGAGSSSLDPGSSDPGG